MMWIVIIGIGALVYYALREGGVGPQKRESKSPEDILREKLAKGEIDEETYEKRREIIRK